MAFRRSHEKAQLVMELRSYCLTAMLTYCLTCFPHLHIIGCTHAEVSFLEEVKQEEAVTGRIDKDICSTSTSSNKQQLYFSHTFAQTVSEEGSVLEEALAVYDDSLRASFSSVSTPLNLDLRLVDDVSKLTFDGELALMILSVSLTWTMAVCTVLAMTHNIAGLDPPTFLYRVLVCFSLTM